LALFLYIAILIFEILYYSLFIKLAKKEGKLWKYLLTFVLETIIIFIFNLMNVITYFIFIITTLLFLKYLVKVKTSIFDMLLIFIMLLIKVLIELPFYMLFSNSLGIYVTGIIYSIVKMLLLYVFRNELHIMYNNMQKLWKNNNFYIRYIFSTFMFIYAITSCIFIILYYL